MNTFKFNIESIIKYVFYYGFIKNGHRGIMIIMQKKFGYDKKKIKYLAYNKA